MTRNAIGVEDAVLLDNKLWFILSDYKCLVSMDIDTKETNSYTIPSDGLYTQKRAYGSIALVGRKMYLIPLYDNALWQFDVDLTEFTKINLDSKLIENDTALFLGIGVYQNYLFVMGVFVPIILRVNTLNNHVDYISDWYPKVENLIFDTKESFFRKQSVIKEDKLYVPFCNANAILEIDCNNMETFIHSLGKEKQGYSGICFNGDRFWLSPRKNGSVVKWNSITRQVVTIHISDSREMSDVLTYLGIIANDDKKLLVPFMNREMRYTEEENVYELIGTYMFIQDNENNIIIYDRCNGIFTVIERTSNVQSKIEIGKVHLDIEKIMYENNNFILEKEEINIQDFVNFAKRKE